MRICIFGASTTYGTGDLKSGGWVDRLKNYLAQQNYQNQVYNLGISGATSEMLLERMECEAKPRRPNVVIVGLGGNDSSYRQNLGKRFVEPDKFKNNLNKVFEIAGKYTDKIIFLGTYAMDENKTCPVEWNEDVYYKNKDLEEYNSMVEDFCNGNNINFINIYNLDFTKNLIDGVHVDSEGHEKIFQKVKEELIKFKVI
jgi:lysophospholipase L1-like esterase